MMSKLVGKFTIDMKYSESPSLPTILAADVASLSGLAGNLGDAARPSFGCSKFEFILPLPTATGVAVSGSSVLVIDWSAWAFSVLAGKAGQSSLYVKTLGKNYGMSG